jgi:F-type H+-transporting ATPase subunit b
VKQLRRPIVLILLVLPALMFMSSEEEHHESNPMEFVGKIVNFVILFGGLGFLLYKPLKKFLEGRGLEIERSIKDTNETRRASEARLEEARIRVEELNGEIASMRSEAEARGKADKEGIVDRARQEADRLQQLAHQEIGLISQNVTRELREYAAGLATDQARERIRARLTPEHQARLIDRSIDKLESLYEKSGSG